MSDTIGQALIYALILILPLSALAARRLPIATTLRYVIAWVAIFVVGVLIAASFT
jgi:aspartyl protease family protein